ncbi:androgen-binding protein homolog [Microtus pennsylvanicus]|uniref:androgen-binding protein homolog n=1 Tax=Microtus pennsylvanicus TaxID=10058 RepID=UPI003F6B5757
MKGTLLLLALLLTGELGFQTTEACIPYFEAYTTMVLGNKKLLNVLLTKFHPTDGEREAANKVQECFNEAGLKAKILDSIVLHLITNSPECKQYYTQDIKNKIDALLSNVFGK